MNATAKATQNAVTLIEAAVARLQLAGWSEERIVGQIPMLAAEAVKFLADKGR